MHADRRTDIYLASSRYSPSPSGRKYGGGGVLTPNHVTPVFLNILYLKDSEKIGVTLRTHSFLLENLKRVLKNHNFLEKIRKYVFAHGAS